MMSSVDAALAAARARGVHRLDAQALLAALLARPRAWLLAHGDAVVPLDARQRYDALTVRRVAGEPLAYLLGEREFFGLSLSVTPDVLIPRPDTETLVDWALELLPRDSCAAVADLGTGSGAIALALASQRPRLVVTAVDASDAALAVARGNGMRLGLMVEWLASDWCSALQGRRYALIASNPPYVAEADPHLAELAYEPKQALTAGADGLDAIRRITTEAVPLLEAGGWLLIEHGHEQADAVAALLHGAGLQAVATRADLAGRPRCTGGRRAS